MSNSPQSIGVEILGKEYRIACPPEARQDLERAANLLNSRMEGIQSQGKLYGTERVAIMAALNLANDLLNSTGGSQTLQSQLGEMNTKIENALTTDQQLDLGES